MIEVTIAGGGPAGASAAIAAIGEGGSAVVYEPSRFPRHKVCGEFLSPEILPLLEHLGAAQAFAAASPARIRRMEIHLGSRTKSAVLPEPAFGLSRYRFDSLLLDRARSIGAMIVNEPAPASLRARPLVIAHGRRENQPRGSRLFGFKAHFDGPPSDAVELFFQGRAYTGLNAIEGGLTNVCGIAPESLLREYGFDVDEFVESCPALAERLRPLRRTMQWFTTGPLVFRNLLRQEEAPGVYRAGDALSFVDPFTGSGLLSAVSTGAAAGFGAATGQSQSAYQARCREILERPFGISTLLRISVEKGWAEGLLWLAPAQLLFRATRPRVQCAAGGNHSGERQ